MRPNDNSARPPASTRRGPATATSGWASSTSSRRSIAPAGTTVSLLRSRRFVPLLARMPMLVPRANPRLSPVSMTRTPGCRRAASALPSDDALSTTITSWLRAGGASCSACRQRSRSARALNETMTMETIHGCASHPRRLFERGERLAAGHRPAVSGQHVGRGRQQPRARGLVEQELLDRARDRLRVSLLDVERGGAAAFARDRRVEQDRRRAGRERLERRQAEALVFRQEREGPGLPVQVAQLLVRDVLVPADPAAGRPRRRSRRPMSSWGKLRLSPARSRDASGCSRATAANAWTRSTTWRRLKIDPTNRTRGSRPPEARPARRARGGRGCRAG